jgi:hypothetical protein
VSDYNHMADEMTTMNSSGNGWLIL